MDRIQNATAASGGAGDDEAVHNVHDANNTTVVSNDAATTVAHSEALNSSVSGEDSAVPRDDATPAPRGEATPAPQDDTIPTPLDNTIPAPSDNATLAPNNINTPDHSNNDSPTETPREGSTPAAAAPPPSDIPRMTGYPPTGFSLMGDAFHEVQGFYASLAREWSQPTNDTTIPEPQYSPQHQPRSGLATLNRQLTPGPPSATQPVYYTLPFQGTDDRPALLAVPFTHLILAPTSNDTDPPRSDGQLLMSTPQDAIFIPRSVSRFPFNILYAADDGCAWPVISLQVPEPGIFQVRQNLGMRHSPHFVALAPFFLHLEILIPPSAEKANTFVDSLETADAELRSRMARLGIGNIGEDSQLGCPVCLDNYDDSADRPEWLDGQEAQNNRVAVVPCPGFHTMHRKCLKEWLTANSPSHWSCPMCRCSISADELTGARMGKSTNGAASLQKAIEAKSQSLREEIHKRERKQGFLCDYPACFPDYDAGIDAAKTLLDRQIVKLAPCNHELHLECLCTSMKVTGGLTRPTPEDAEEDTYDEETLRRGYTLAGKWVECPIDKKEVWTQIPVPVKRRNLPAEEGGCSGESTQPTPDSIE